MDYYLSYHFQFKFITNIPPSAPTNDTTSPFRVPQLKTKLLALPPLPLLLLNPLLPTPINRFPTSEQPAAPPSCLSSSPYYPRHTNLQDPLSLIVPLPAHQTLFS